MMRRAVGLARTAPSPSPSPLHRVCAVVASAWRQRRPASAEAAKGLKLRQGPSSRRNLVPLAQEQQGGGASEGGLDDELVQRAEAYAAARVLNKSSSAEVREELQKDVNALPLEERLAVFAHMEQAIHNTLSEVLLKSVPEHAYKMGKTPEMAAMTTLLLRISQNRLKLENPDTSFADKLLCRVNIAQDNVALVRVVGIANKKIAMIHVWATMCMVVACAVIGHELWKDEYVGLYDSPLRDAYLNATGPDPWRGRKFTLWERWQGRHKDPSIEAADHSSVATLMYVDDFFNNPDATVNPKDDAMFINFLENMGDRTDAKRTSDTHVKFTSFMQREGLSSGLLEADEELEAGPEGIDYAKLAQKPIDVTGNSYASRISQNLPFLSV